MRGKGTSRRDTCREHGRPRRPWAPQFHIPSRQAPRVLLTRSCRLIAGLGPRAFKHLKRTCGSGHSSGSAITRSPCSEPCSRPHHTERVRDKLPSSQVTSQHAERGRSCLVRPPRSLRPPAGGCPPREPGWRRLPLAEARVGAVCSAENMPASPHSGLHADLHGHVVRPVTLPDDHHPRGLVTGRLQGGGVQLPALYSAGLLMTVENCYVAPRVRSLGRPLASTWSSGDRHLPPRPKRPHECLGALRPPRWESQAAPPRGHTEKPQDHGGGRYPPRGTVQRPLVGLHLSPARRLRPFRSLRLDASPFHSPRWLLCVPHTSPPQRGPAPTLRREHPLPSSLPPALTPHPGHSARLLA